MVTTERSTTPGYRKLCLAGTLLVAAMTTQVAAQTPPKIEEIRWPWIDSYCTFMKADHTFVFDDLKSWRFVFFSPFSEKGNDIMQRGFMRIDGQLRELALKSVTKIDASEQRRYHSHDDPPYLIEVVSEAGKPTYEAVGYSGRITVSRQGATSSVMFKGDCGV